MGTGQLGQDGTLSIRAFFGLPVPQAQRQQLEPYLAACAAQAPDFRSTPSANLHLTIRFIGNVEPSVADGIADRLAEQPLAGFTLELGDVGTFQRGRLVRVVWLQLRGGAEPARELAALVEAAGKRRSVCLIAAPAPLAAPLAYASSLTLRCAAAGWHLSHGDVAGLRVHLTTAKSRVSVPGAAASVLLRYPRPYATAEVVGLPTVVRPRLQAAAGTAAEFEQIAAMAATPY